MASPFFASDAERRDDYLASAADADKRAASSTDQIIRTAWVRVADGYRELAAGMAPHAIP
jgi:hypothetical protein